MSERQENDLTPQQCAEQIRSLMVNGKTAADVVKENPHLVPGLDLVADAQKAPGSGSTVRSVKYKAL